MFATKYRRKVFYGERHCEMGLNAEEIMQMKRGKCSGSRSVSGSCIYKYCLKTTEQDLWGS